MTNLPNPFAMLLPLCITGVLVWPITGYIFGFGISAAIAAALFALSGWNYAFVCGRSAGLTKRGTDVVYHLFYVSSLLTGLAAYCSASAHQSLVLDLFGISAEFFQAATATVFLSTGAFQLIAQGTILGFGQTRLEEQALAASR